MSAKREGWTFRIMQEYKNCTQALFLTLTYDPEHVPMTESGCQTLRKNHIQLFMKRIRATASRNPELTFPAPLKYYAIGEYGSKKMRPHYHVMAFNIPNFTDRRKLIKFLEDHWTYGHVDIGNVEPASVQYVTSYVINKYVHDEYDEREKPFSLISKGFGMSYLTPEKVRYHQNNGEFLVRNNDNSKIKLPRYYAEKVFTSFDRELNKLKLQPGLDHKHEENTAKAAELSSNNPYFYRMQLETQARAAFYKKVKKGGTL